MGSVRLARAARRPRTIPRWLRRIPTPRAAPPAPKLVGRVSPNGAVLGAACAATGSLALGGGVSAMENEPPPMSAMMQKMKAAGKTVLGGVQVEASRQARAGDKTVLFDCSKREIFTPSSGLKAFRRKLNANFKLAINKDTITLDVLRQAALVVFVGPRERFSSAEFEAMGTYLSEGGSILVTLGEGGEGAFGTNINYFCEEYGMAFNADAVVRTVYYKYLHPKEVHIANGVLNKSINVAAGKRVQKGAGGGAVPPAISDSSPNSSLAFAYPYGASLNVAKPAFPVLSSGALSFPLNRPVCALWTGDEVPGKPPPGRLCLLGSSYVVHDDWFDKDENAKLMVVLAKWCALVAPPRAPLDRRQRGALLGPHLARLRRDRPGWATITAGPKSRPRLV